MADNFFLDNQDLQFHLDNIDLEEIVKIKERDYSNTKDYVAAPRHYQDAKDNYRLLLDVLGDVSANVIAPLAPEADKEGAQFRDGEVYYAHGTEEAMKALKQAELMGIMLPWEYGGMNLPETIYQMMVEIVSRAEAGLMTIFGLQEISLSLNEFGSEEQKAAVLPRFARGEVAGAMVLTEPDAGSDLGAVQTKATWDEEAGVWRINGVKRFITNGVAEIMMVLARSEEGTTDARGLSLYLLERDETVKIRRIEDKIGIHTSPTCEIEYNNTPAQLIGKRRFGLVRYAMGLMNGARLAVSAQALGIAEAAYREALRYAEERVQFNKPIRDIPAVSRMLLSMRGEIEATRALLYETSRWVDLSKTYDHYLTHVNSKDKAAKARRKQAQALADALTPLTKYYATEMGNRVCYQAMQVHGGVGYMREFNVERHYRDIRVTNIYEGTSQLQVVAIISKLLGGGLNDILAEWAALEYGEALAGLKSQLEKATQQLQESAQKLKEHERDVIDYYAADLADMAVYVVNSWLLLQAARHSERKQKMAQVYVAEHLPQVYSAAMAIQAADSTPLEARTAILTGQF